MDFSSKQAELDEFRASLSDEDRERFNLNSGDTPEDTFLAMVKELIRLRERVEDLENFGS